jgi:hypothetical protein
LPPCPADHMAGRKETRLRKKHLEEQRPFPTLPPSVSPAKELKAPMPAPISIPLINPPPSPSLNISAAIPTIPSNTAPTARTPPQPTGLYLKFAVIDYSFE